MKQLTTIVLLFCVCLACGCSDKKGQDQKQVITGAYFNSEKDWSFIIDGRMTRFNWTNGGTHSPQTPFILHDVPDGDPYIIWYDFYPTQGSDCKVVKEIHLRKEQEINSGAEDRGKYGLHKWNKLE